jgi:hypothetical protein
MTPDSSPVSSIHFFGTKLYRITEEKIFKKMLDSQEEKSDYLEALPFGNASMP